MNKVNIHEAKTHFSKLVKAAMDGKETIIARSGKPVAKLVPIEKAKPKRKIGLSKGKFKVPDDINFDLPEDMLDAMEGKDPEDPLALPT